MSVMSEQLFFNIIEKHFVGSGAKVFREYKHDKIKSEKGRCYSFDVGVPLFHVLFEWHGGIWNSQTGHRTAKGVTRDHRKVNQAGLWGFRVFSYTEINIGDLKDDLNVLWKLNK